MGRYRVTTVRGYSLFDVASALQKTIRRCEPGLAVYFACELFASGFWRYVWKRLLVISVEDCAGLITQEVKALYDSFLAVNHNSPKKDRPEGRLFLAKAAILLALSYKSRDADHAIVFGYDRSRITDEEVDKYLSEIGPDEKVEIPDYALDCHTVRGKAMGRTIEEFIVTEQRALKPRIKGLFDGYVDTD